MTIANGYNVRVEYSVAQAKGRLAELIRAAEAGEKIVITRHGKPVVHLTRLPPSRRRKLGWAGGRKALRPGWDEPVRLSELLGDRD